MPIASADQFGDFTYDVVDEVSITIVDYPTEAVGPVVIPAEIVGLPVTAIASYAFEECSGITSVTIPGSVNAIGENAFAQCLALTSVRIPNGVTIIEGSTFEGCDALVSVTIPGSVTEIATFAFFDCIGLKDVIIPASVTNIGNSAFDQCTALDLVFFMGNAPTLGETVFEDQASNPDLRIHYFNGKVDFTTPDWEPLNYQFSYKTINMGAENPLAPWLAIQGLPFNSNLYADANGDGVNLLMAYALDLDPAQNLSGSLPQPVFSESSMSLSFYSGSPGITYVVKTCDDLTDWTTVGVSLSAPDDDLVRTATVNFSGPVRFMRLEVRN